MEGVRKSRRLAKSPPVPTLPASNLRAPTNNKGVPHNVFGFANSTQTKWLLIGGRCAQMNLRGLNGFGLEIKLQGLTSRALKSGGCKRKNRSVWPRSTISVYNFAANALQIAFMNINSAIIAPAEKSNFAQRI
jgi:hypothetical protein